MVVHDPGDWFEDVLTSLATQDYPRISHLFIDTGATVDIAPIVQAILPDATIRNAKSNPGFSKAANDVLGLQNLAPYLLICHDDVALEPDAISRMLEESIRSNAGIVGPKLVDWDDARVLRQVGLGVDKTGALAPQAEPGEFDQEQHDGVRDVFAIPGGAMLIRTDLFRALGGFDPVMKYRGEHVDLCWRAHVAGARVLIVPNAVARHREALAERLGDTRSADYARRNRVRQVLSNYGGLHSLLVIPQAIMTAIGTVVYLLATGRVASARSVVGAWTWNFANSGSILTRRRELASLRKLGDAEVRGLQVAGFESVNRYVRSRADRGSVDNGVAGRALAFATSREGRVLSAVWLGIVGVVLFGSRHFITDGVPVLNELVAFPERPAELWSDWFSSYRSGGLGSEGFAPTATGLIALAGNLFLGQMGLLRTALTVGMIILGAIGVARLIGNFNSLGASTVAPLVYVSVPLPYNALVNGSWSGLLMYAGTPWILAGIANGAGLRPFNRPPRTTAWLRDIVALGLVVALVGAFVPFVVVTVGVVLLAVILGGIVTGRPGRIDRLVITAMGGIAVAFLLHLPWSTSFLSGDSTWARLGHARQTLGGELTIGDLFRFETGPHGGAPLGWALLALAVVALVLARGDRLVWTVRAWMLILGGITVAWGAQRGFIDYSLPRPEVLLVPSALGIAISAGMAVMSFETDLRAYRFGWRQAVPAIALVSLLAATFAGLGATFNGRWQTPRGGLETASAFLSDGREDAARVLWIGDDDAVPVGALRYDDQISVATTRSQLPTLVDFHAPIHDDAQQLIFDGIDAALQGGTSRMGSYLAPLGIRYIVLIERAAPAPFSETELPAPARLVGRLAEQLDLKRVEVRDGLTVYENSSWVPVVASFPPDTVPTGSSGSLALAFDLPQARRALPEANPPTEYDGPVAADTEIYVASPATERWELLIDDVPAIRSRAFGWANVFTVTGDGTAQLRHRTPTTHRLLMLGQVALWIVATVVALQPRRRSR